MPFGKTGRGSWHFWERKNGQGIRRCRVRTPERAGLIYLQDEIWIPHSTKTGIDRTQHHRRLRSQPLLHIALFAYRSQRSNGRWDHYQDIGAAHVSWLLILDFRGPSSVLGLTNSQQLECELNSGANSYRKDDCSQPEWPSK